MCQMSVVISGLGALAVVIGIAVGIALLRSGNPIGLGLAAGGIVNGVLLLGFGKLIDDVDKIARR